MAEKIYTDKAPAAIGPYSQGIVYGGFVFTSGQIPLDPATGALVSGTVREQTVQALKNLGAVLQAAGSGLDRIVKTTCYLADMGDFAVFNEEYAKLVPTAPARSCVAVKALPKGALVEIEAIAYTDGNAQKG